MTTRMAPSLLLAGALIGACADLDPPTFGNVYSDGLAGGAFSLPTSAAAAKGAAAGSSSAKNPPRSASGNGGASAGASGGARGVGTASAQGGAAAPGGAAAAAPNVASGGSAATTTAPPTAAGGAPRGTSNAEVPDENVASLGGAGAESDVADAGAATSAGSGAQGAGGMMSEPEPPPCFFSEYVEGTKNLKALAITCSEAAVLDGCRVDVYANGALKASRHLPLTGALQPPSSVVLCSAELAAVNAGCTVTAALSFNGNDALTLVCDESIIDAFGCVGENPGDAGWGAAPTSTTDMSWSRRCSVSSGDTNPSDPFDPALEWTALGADITTGLDAHCAEMPPLP